MSALTRRAWLLKHPIPGSLLLTTAIALPLAPLFIVPAASSGVDGAIFIALGALACGWLAGVAVGVVLIRRAARSQRLAQASD